MPRAENATRSAPPYVPWRTFSAAIERLEQGVPNQIDRSVWPSYSGATQGQLVAAFKFLGLVDDKGIPTPTLHELTKKDRPSQKIALGNVIQNAYPQVIKLGLQKASPKQLNDAFRHFGLTGETHRKAVSFFLHAARHAELPLSPLLKRKTREAGSHRRRNDSAGPKRTPVPLALPPEESLTAETKTVDLRSGGSLTMILSLKLTGMGREDRKFVFDLLDRMRAYEQAASKKPAKT